MGYMVLRGAGLVVVMGGGGGIELVWRSVGAFGAMVRWWWW